MLRKNLIISIAFLFLLAKTYCAVEIAGGFNYFDASLDGKVKSEGIKINVKDDLGLKDDNVEGGFLKIGLGKHHFLFNFSDFEFKGANTLSRQITFRNKTYTINTYVESKLEYSLYEFLYYYDLLKLCAVKISPLFKVSLYDAEVNIKGGGNDESYSENLPLPTIGLRAQADFKYIALFSQVNGIGYSDASYIEYIGGVILKPLKYLRVMLAYKGTNVDYENDENLIDIDVDGFFAQIGVYYKF